MSVESFDGFDDDQCSGAELHEVWDRRSKLRSGLPGIVKAAFAVEDEMNESMDNNCPGLKLDCRHAGDLSAVKLVCSKDYDECYSHNFGGEKK